eukprot:7483218-Alexandrium_andersonii.AAC.1
MPGTGCNKHQGRRRPRTKPRWLKNQGKRQASGPASRFPRKGMPTLGRQCARRRPRCQRIWPGRRPG